MWCADRFINLYKLFNGNMGIDRYFQFNDDERTEYIRDEIVVHLPEKERIPATTKARVIAENYEGQDFSAIYILGLAAKKGRFDEFAEKLEDQYRTNLQFVHPGARGNMRVPGAAGFVEFFHRCYTELGISLSLS